jgi:hypothetical protein
MSSKSGLCSLHILARNTCTVAVDLYVRHPLAPCDFDSHLLFKGRTGMDVANFISVHNTRKWLYDPPSFKFKSLMKFLWRRMTLANESKLNNCVTAVGCGVVIFGTDWTGLNILVLVANEKERERVTARTARTHETPNPLTPLTRLDRPWHYCIQWIQCDWV